MIYFFKFIFIYFDRERERMGERESQAGSTLSAEPNSELDLTTVRS